MLWSVTHPPTVRAFSLCIIGLVICVSARQWGSKASGLTRLLSLTGILRTYFDYKMLCEQCLAFWRTVETEISSPDSQRIRHDLPTGGLQIRWPCYSATLHNSLAQLERAAKKRCHICFCIFRCCRAYNSQGAHIEGLELGAGLDPEVVLELKSSSRRSAVLSAAYRCRIGTDRAGEVVATTTIGVFDGLFADGKKPPCIPVCQKVRIC